MTTADNSPRTNGPTPVHGPSRYVPMFFAVTPGEPSVTECHVCNSERRTHGDSNFHGWLCPNGHWFIVDRSERTVATDAFPYFAPMAELRAAK